MLNEGKETGVHKFELAGTVGASVSNLAMKGGALLGC